MEAIVTKVTLPVNTLQDIVSRAVQGSTFISVIPMTSLMQIKIKDGVIYAKTTDNINQLIIKDDVNAQGQPDFEMFVDSKIFSQLVSKLSGDKVDLIKEGDKVTILSGGTFNIAAATDTDGSELTYDDIKVEPIGSSFHLEANEVKSILSYNEAAKSETREQPQLFNYYANSDYIITTDGNRACINPIKMTDTPICIAPNIMDLVETLLYETNDGKAQGVDVYQNTDYIVFENQKGTLIGRKCSQSDVDAFPGEAVVEIMSNDLDNKIEINRTQLLDSLDRLCVLANENDRAALFFNFTKDYVEITSEKSKSFEKVNYMSGSEANNDITLPLEGLRVRDVIATSATEKVSLSFDNDGIRIKDGDTILALGSIE